MPRSASHPARGETPLQPPSLGAEPGGAAPLRIGRLTRAHGLKGDLEVRLDWPDSRALLDAKRVLLSPPEGSSAAYVIASARPTGKGILLRLEGVGDRDAAEALCGATVSVQRADLPPLEAGEYYLCDLVGLDVAGPSGPVGRVIEIQMYPSVDAVVIEAPDGARYEQPLLAAWLEQVDVAGQGIRLRSLDGLLELQAASSGKDGR